MLKKIMVVVLVLAAAFTLYQKSCIKKPENKQMGSFDGQYYVFPPFAKVFESLDYLDKPDYDSFLPTVYRKNLQTTHEMAFYFGILAADAIVATNARNREKLMSIAHQMRNYSKTLGIGDEMLQLADVLINHLDAEEWDELKHALDEYSRKIEEALYHIPTDLMTLVQAGGWAEGINITCQILLKDYDVEKTDVLRQSGTVQNIVENLQKISEETLREHPWIKDIITGFDKIYEIVINKEEHDRFAVDEVHTLRDITKVIVDS